MRPFLTVFKTKPLYLFLLPLFFVLHGFLENFGFIAMRDAAILYFSYVVLTVSITIFSWIFFRNWTKAAIITLVWMSFFFFFGAIHEFMKEQMPVKFFSKYSFLLGAFFLVLVFTFIYLKKVKKPFFKMTFFLNLLFAVYVLIDAGGVILKSFQPEENRLSVYDFAKQNQYTVGDTSKRPDIYFLLMDEYSSSLALNEQFHYNNYSLDSFLLRKGFTVQGRSHSNYNFTPFSMSATLNMSFIDGIKNTKSVTAEDYASAVLLVRDNEVIKFLDAYGYEIVNYSVFDLAGHPTAVFQSFLPIKTKLITDRTLFARMNKDIGWLLMTWYPFKWFKKNYVLQHRDNNLRLQDLVEKSTREKSLTPRFIYAHFYMPHAPYYYDGAGNLKDNETIYTEFKNNSLQAYLDYLPYVNGRIEEMINAIQKNDPEAIIILLSDHGFRKNGEKADEPAYYFQNLNAIYYPDRNYTGLYDSITNINLFRTVFNQRFEQHFPLLQDSTIFLVDKKPTAH